VALMNIKSAWNRFWFSEGSYFDLAVLRIIAVGTQLFYLLNETFSTLAYVYTLPRAIYHPLFVLRPFVWPWGLTTPPPSQVMFGIYGLSVFLGFASLFGLFTNVSMLLFAICCIVLQAFVFSFGQFHHPEAIMLIALLAIALGPAGKVLSVDSLIRQPRGGVPMPLLDYSGEFAGWPVRFIQCLFPLVYISAAIAKLSYNHYSLDWANGYTLQYYFIQDHIRKDLPLAFWASQYHTLILLSQYVVLLYQCTYWLVVPYPKLRWLYLPVGFTFHLANYLILYAPFPQWIALLAAYIPWSVAVRRLASKQVLAAPTGVT
jgi:hypothetical protein